MFFWKSKLGTLLVLSVLAASLLSGIAAFRVHRLTVPPRLIETPVDFASMKLPIEPVRFPAADGTEIAGWWMPADPSRPAVVLGHDLAAGKVALLNLMLRLHDRGIPCLALDFRAHGESGGERSTLGVDEKRDLLGAVDFVATRSDAAGVGAIYGVGMGAHAAVLAAADRPGLGVLILDGLYPDAAFALERRASWGWEPADRALAFLPRAILRGARRSPVEARAAEVLPRLAGRHMLLLTPASDPRLAAEAEAMYRTIPEHRESDASLMELPATAVTGVYGEAMEGYHRKITEFLLDRM